ncbi:alpha/beta fold hydrolase [Streptomyces sp.]|uniref:alpha/beta fold hydrolase n=1 Tax=Streptomyces sp. TaxID=1931 RepID=UPI002811BD8E|nr:alpha/beta fold hydrolase [Streptomyces sp.]
MHKVVSRDGTTIAYEKAGEGPPIVLLGGGFRDHTAFDTLVPYLTPHCTVYAYDRRGRGQSGDSPHYAVEREIEDLQAVIDGAGGRAAVFGGSSGAILALEAALAGAAISRLALLEPPYRVPGFRTPPAGFAGHLDALLAAGRRGEAVEYFLGEHVGFPPEWVKEWKDSPLWPSNEALAHTLPYDTAVMGDGRVPVERMAGMRVETLVVNSDHTSDWLLAAAEATAAALPDGRRLELPGVWHRVLPEVLGPVLVDFVTA